MEYLFNPFQLKEFGKKFFQDENQAFSYRYQLIKRFGFINSILVPFGPICKDFNGFKSFLKNILQRKFSKITIDLPMILDPQIKEEITHELLKQGFKLQEYKILDSETIVIKKEKFKPEKRVKRYIRSGYRNFDILIKKNLTESELNEIYSIYINQKHIQDFNPKPIDAFKISLKNGVASIAYNKKDKKIEGFLIGYIWNIPINYKKNNYKKILSLVFTGMTDFGKEKKVGFALHGEIFKKSFEDLNIELIDFLGADRSKGRKYVKFKSRWGGEFVKHPGSFTKLVIF